MRLRPIVSRGLFFIAFLALLFAAGPAVLHRAGLYAAQYTGAYYAFYFDSGEIVYGKVRAVGWGTLTLRDAYTFQTVAVGETSTSNLQAQAQNLLTAPDNWLTLNMDRVLFFEKLGPEARARQLMEASQ